MKGSDHWHKRPLLSLEYHRLSAEKIRSDHSLLDKVRRNLDRMIEIYGESKYSLEWGIILKLRVDLICDHIVEPGEHMDELRHYSPVNGLISEEERQDTFEKVMGVRLGDSPPLEDLV